MIYGLVAANGPEDLERKVNEKLAAGWTLHGPPVVSVTHQMVQAVVKEGRPVVEVARMGGGGAARSAVKSPTGFTADRGRVRCWG